MEEDCLVALAGNPNVGKSTIFNNLTGMHQRTGNWTGVTVGLTRGRCRSGEKSYTLVDLPGCYSLSRDRGEEAAAGEFLRSGRAQAVILICDASCLERSLVPAIQCMAICPRMLLCVNLVDEAECRGIRVDIKRLSEALKLPVIGISGREKASGRLLLDALDRLMETPERELPETEPDVKDCFLLAGKLCAESVSGADSAYSERDRKLDRLTLGKRTAFPLMLLLLTAVLFLTVYGANLISDRLSAGLSALEDPIRRGLFWMGLPERLVLMLTEGAWRVLAWVVSVMLPPMAIFFPLFSLLEEMGYLPRVACCLDRPFQRCGSCGRQGLCMMMGFGCNAVGITGARIMSERRERLLAILTNAFVPCNGRFPLLITILTLFFSSVSPLLAPLLLGLVVVFSVCVSFAATRLLSLTLLKGRSAPFVLELPPYRRPQWGKLLLRSLLDRTLVVLGRAAAAAAPAGAILWLLAQTGTQEANVLTLLSRTLDPVGRMIGMDGVILLAFLLALPANELTLPLMMMLYSAGRSLTAIGSMDALRELLLSQGWTWLTALCVILFTLFHWPCATSLLTVRKETGSMRWTLVSALLPTLFGFGLCALTRAIVCAFSAMI